MGGYLRWVDRPPATIANLYLTEKYRQGQFVSGFVGQLGPIFEDMRDHGSAPFAIPVFLASRLFVGTITGLAHMPSKATTTYQIIALLVVFGSGGSRSRVAAAPST